MLLAPSKHSRPVLQHPQPTRRAYAFRVPLEADQGISLMRYGHVHIIGAMRNRQQAGTFQPFNRKRVIPHSRERIRQAIEQRMVLMHDVPHFAMHRLGGMNELSPKMHSYRLVAEADAEDRDLIAEMSNGLHGNACVFRSTRAGGDNEPFRMQINELLQAQCVITIYVAFASRLLQVMMQDMGERIVIIDQDPHAQAGYD